MRNRVRCGETGESACRAIPRSTLRRLWRRCSTGAPSCWSVPWWASPSTWTTCPWGRRSSGLQPAQVDRPDGAGRDPAAPALAPRSPPPALPAAMADWERRAAQASHFLLYRHPARPAAGRRRPLLVGQLPGGGLRLVHPAQPDRAEQSLERILSWVHAAWAGAGRPGAGPRRARPCATISCSRTMSCGACCRGGRRRRVKVRATRRGFAGLVLAAGAGFGPGAGLGREDGSRVGFVATQAGAPVEGRSRASRRRSPSRPTAWTASRVP